MVVSRELPNQRCYQSHVVSSVSVKVWDDSHVQAKLFPSPEEEEVGILNHHFCVNSPVEVKQ